MLESDAVERVAQLDVNAQIVGVQFQLVAGLDGRVFIDVERERGYGAVKAEAPVLITLGCAVECDQASEL